MGCSEKKLSKNLTQTFMAYCNVMIYQQATLSGEAERLKVADAVIEAHDSIGTHSLSIPFRRHWPPSIATTRKVIRRCHPTNWRWPPSPSL